MKQIIILFIVLAVVSAKHHEKYANFLKKHNKKTDHLTEEVQFRREKNYFANADFIERHNKKNLGFHLGENEYANRDQGRFVEEMCKTVLPAQPRALPAITLPTTPAKAAVNWTIFALPVVNQGGCGSCWAFATAAVIGNEIIFQNFQLISLTNFISAELYNSIRKLFSIPLSQQNIVDCDPFDHGCSGGWPTTALSMIFNLSNEIFPENDNFSPSDYIKNNMSRKLAKAADYAYTSGSTRLAGTCKNVTTPQFLNFNSTYQDYLNGNETKLMSYISNYGPAAIAMYVPPSGTFGLYKGGIYYDPTCPVSNATFNQCNMVNHGEKLFD